MQVFSLILASSIASRVVEFPLILNIAVALAVAFAGGLLASRLRLPPMIGYLLAGIVIGPFTPGYVGDQHTLQELAELGVIFLLFGVGLHFSLRDLWAVRDIALPGALIQMFLSTLLGLLLASIWGWTFAASIILGLAVSIASTVVLLRNLTDQGLLQTTHGQVAVGWLVLEDLATVVILVLIPAFSAKTTEPLWLTVGLALLKTAFFVAFMLLVGTRLIPWLLKRINLFHSRELFIVAVMVIAVGTALEAAVFFDVSLALGAFLAGVVVHESSLSHQAEEEILPFRETFAVLFFVSVGMLVNPLLLFSHPWQILWLVLLIVVGKGLIVLLLGLFFARPARTILVVAVALSQIGEFSFLLGKAGVDANIFTQEQYQLLLMGSLLSILLNPLLFMALPRIEACLRTIPVLWRLLDRHNPVEDPVGHLRDHVVIIGYGQVGRSLVDVLSSLDIALLVVEMDSGRVKELQARSIPTLQGNAANSEILSHARLQEARAVVVTLPDELASSSCVATVHDLAPQVPLLAGASSRESVVRLVQQGAWSVISPELEGCLALLTLTLEHLSYTKQDIQRYLVVQRQDLYDFSAAHTRQVLSSHQQDSLEPEEQEKRGKSGPLQQ